MKWSEICNYSLNRVPLGNNKTITVHLCKILRNLSNREENVKNRLPTCSAQVFLRGFMMT